MTFSGNVKNKIKKVLNRRSSMQDLAMANQDPSLLCLHLGCGSNYLDGWLNIDIIEGSRADLIMNFKELPQKFKPDSVSEVLMIHSISYLRLWEARDFFSNVYSLLKSTGKFTLEFPDLAKCSKALLSNENKVDDYLEAVRAIYAFDMDQIKRKDNFQPYAFGWSSWHITSELKKVGFKKIMVEEPQTHGPLLWRDTRIVAIK